ncbi:uncharacterized protein LOC115454221 [Manduca sexta]|uniref:uncharacterized protein LOC115454221 n=1 Tax=Manduca sexta TaxID=7130 RepID=UPI00188ED99E|nr:uncharacterized protein LOC115454221 [Manduca sexta]
MESSLAESSCETENSQEYTVGVRLIVLNLPEDEGEGLGFRLTRTLWDPYPWVREVTPGSRADGAGLKTGDCILQADGKDLLGLPVGQVAGLIRGDGAGRGVSLLVWNCGVDPKDDPELLWSCGGGSRGEKSRRALAGVVKALSCCVCASTATRALNCARSHLYCEACWTRLEKCALCREILPAKDSPYARNLVAEQVFEAIATEYEIKTTPKRTATSTCTPNRSPNLSPSSNRKGQYQLSMMNRKKAVHFNENYRHTHSDPNIPRSLTERNVTSLAGTSCQCKDGVQNNDEIKLQHKLVTRVRQACSMADLANVNGQNRTEALTCRIHGHSSSLDNLNCKTGCDTPIFVLSPPPVYVVTCEHKIE